MNRRKFLKQITGSFLTLIGIGAGAYYYARYIEPSMLKVKEEIITSHEIPDIFDQFTIVQFSDTHLGFQYTLDQFSNLVQTINANDPDIVVFTGDLVDNPNQYNWDNKLVHLLQSIHAKHGKYAVYGNHDHGGYGTNILRNVLEKSNFHLLKNEHVSIEINNDRIILAGIDDVILGRPNLETALENANPEYFTILLSHEPDFADRAMKSSVNVQLSGHSHGGQVRFPLLGHLITPRYARKYVKGKYNFHDEDFTLFVNSGIGTTRLPYRFLCTPEIHVYTLKTS